MDDWTQPIIKTASLLTSVICIHLSLSPPNPAVQEAECYRWGEKISSLFEPFVRRIMFCTKMIVCIAVVVELYVMALYHFIDDSASRRWHCVESTITMVAVTGDVRPGWATSCSPWIVVGTTLIVFGTLLRLCFRTLGPLFTFEVTIRPKHKLVTKGPYAYVRHPSYSSGLTALAGISLLFLTPEATWVNACGISTWPGMLLSTAWCVVCAVILAGTSSRLRTEDQMLKDTFGEEWDAYKEKVPWSMVPWLF